MNFEYDIFVSYCPSVAKEDQRINEWSSKFCEYLAILMNRLTDKKPTILFQDDLMARSKLLGNESTKIFSKTAVFVTLIAPEYFKSNTYLKELGKISKIINNKSDDSTQKVNRIFKVITSPVDEENEPDFLKNELSYDFFEINRYSKKARTFEINEEDELYEKFWSTLVDLAYDIYNSLNSLMTSEKIKHAKKEKEFIYLAETSIDQKDNRDILKRELQHLGYGIFPSGRLPDNIDELTVVIQDYLEKAVLSIHLMGAYYGDYVNKSKYSLIDIQNQIAKSCIEQSEKYNKLFRIIWIPNDLKPSEQRQSLFLKRLKRDDARLKTEIIEAPLEVIKSILNSKITQIKKSEEPKVKDRIKVYLVYEKNERGNLDKLIKEINNNNYLTLVTDFSSDNDKIIASHLESLIEADAVLVYQGNSGKEWLDSKIRDLIKAPGYGKSKSFKSIGIITKQNPDKSIMDFISHAKITIEKEINPSVIKNFLDPIK